mgnify:CR=1 FL=1
MIYLLNTPVLTSYGKWEFKGPITVARAGQLLSDGFSSAIGHQGTADFLANLLGLEVSLNRVRITMEPGDQALVVRLLERMPEGKVYTEQEMLNIPFEFGVLTRER